MSEKETPPVSNEYKKIRRLSRESFKTKVKKTKVAYLRNKKRINAKYQKLLVENNSEQKNFVLKRKEKEELRRAKNKYAVSYNALINQSLYRKSVLEAKISQLKNQYRQNMYQKITFKKNTAKAELKAKIADLKVRYNTPLSSHYRTSRNAKFIADVPYVKISVDTPFKKIVSSLCLLLLAAFITTLALDVFIKPWGIYNAGLRGITQAYFYLIQKYYPNAPFFLSYVLFFVINIPLAIFGYFKIGKKFTLYTLIFIFFQLLISLSIESSGIYQLIEPFGQKIAKIKEEVGSIKYALPFISAIIGAILYGVGVGLIYRAGGSTGGSKFVVTYISATKNKSIGYIAMLFAIFVISHGIIINKIIETNTNAVSAFTSNVVFASVIFVYLSNWALDKVFAKSRKIEIKLYTKKKDAIIKFLDLYFMYNRSFSVNEVKGGLQSKTRYRFEFVVSYQEAKNMIEIFRRIDQSSFVHTTTVEKVYGKFYNMWFE